jgi:hypothetical protein
VTGYYYLQVQMYWPQSDDPRLIDLPGPGNGTAARPPANQVFAEFGQTAGQRTAPSAQRWTETIDLRNPKVYQRQADPKLMEVFRDMAHLPKAFSQPHPDRLRTVKGPRMVENWPTHH